VTLKVRFGDFTTLTRSRRVGVPLDGALELARVGRELLDRVDVGPGVRLLGISASALEPAGVRQLSLDLGLDTAPTPAAAPSRPDHGAEPAPAARASDATQRPAGTGERRAPVSWDEANDAVEEIRRRFGSAAIGPASLSDSGRLRVVTRGRRPWGPSDEDGPRPAGNESTAEPPDAPQNGRRR